MDCASCRQIILERSQDKRNALDFAADLPELAQQHLEGCSSCRNACRLALQLENQLRELSRPLPAVDVRASVMARIRAGQRQSLPELRPLPARALAGPREILAASLVLALLSWWSLPTLLPWLESQQLGFWPQPWTLSWAVPQLDWGSATPWQNLIVTCLVLLCSQQTWNWWGQSRA